MEYMGYKIRKVPRWRIDTPFERWLGRRADKSELWKRAYVAYYKAFDREYYEGGKRFIDKEVAAYKAQGGVVTDATIRDMIYMHHRYGFAYNEYFPYGFPDKNLEGRLRYVSDKRRFDYLDELNRPENLEYFANKAKTLEVFGQWYKRECLVIDSADQKQDFLDFASRNQTFMRKELYGSGGREVTKVNLEGRDPAAYFDQNLAGGGLLVEEIIVQAPVMAAFHPASINTVRVVTLRTESEGVVLFAAYLRMGQGGSVVDNGAMGGILAGVDTSTGIIYTCGLTEEGVRHISHPDTGTQIVGFNIPHWEEARALVLELADMIPSNRYTGWDLAYTPNGWILVEANDSGQFAIQFCDGVGVRQRFEEAIAWQPRW